MGAHSRLSPSSSARWVPCSASVAAIEEDTELGIIVEDTRPDHIANPAAHWGTQAHLIGEMILLGNTTKEIKSKLPADFREDIECWDCANDYVDYVHNLLRKGSILLVEHRVYLDRWLPDAVIYDEDGNDTGRTERQGGTADAIIVHLDGTIDMIDLKGGMGMVFAKDNSQLKIYSGGIIDEFEMIRDIKKIRTHIVQPRRDHYDVEEYLASEIIHYMNLQVKTSADLIEAGYGVFAPSDKACQWCPRSGYCEAQTKQVTAEIVKDIDSIEKDELELLDPAKLTVKQLIKVQNKAAEIKSFLASVESRIFERLTAGTKTTGFKLVQKNTNRKYASDDATLAKVLEDMGLDDDQIWTSKIATISAVEKLLNAKQKKQFSAHITKPEGLPTLAPTSDKRPAIKPMLTQKELAELEDKG